MGMVVEQVMGVFWGSEGVEGEEVGGDNRKYHENVNC